MTNAFLISVHPRWASAFFLSHKPACARTEKRQLWASLKTGDSIVIYATMPTTEIIGIVQFVKRELLPIEQLWEESEQGKLAKVSRAQLDAYYANQESGIGVWVGGVELLLSSDRTRVDFARTGTTAGSHRSRFSN